MAEMTTYFGSGRRKSSVARVRLTPGAGKILVNRRDFEDYFRGLSRHQAAITEPLKVTNARGKFDVWVNVRGGGVTGQADAIRLGISRALAQIDQGSRTLLRKQGFLTRDPRMVERKKPGRPKARKRFQFSKR